MANVIDSIAKASAQTAQLTKDYVDKELIAQDEKADALELRLNGQYEKTQELFSKAAAWLPVERIYTGGVQTYFPLEIGKTYKITSSKNALGWNFAVTLEVVAVGLSDIVTTMPCELDLHFDAEKYKYQSWVKFCILEVTKGEGNNADVVYSVDGVQYSTTIFYFEKVPDGIVVKSVDDLFFACKPVWMIYEEVSVLEWNEDATLEVKGVPGADGKDGRDGADGKDGRDGKDAEIVQGLGSNKEAAMSQAAVTKVVNAMQEDILINIKHITNLKKGLPDDQVLTDSAVAYEKKIPVNACPYVQIKQVGGMTYRKKNTLPLLETVENTGDACYRYYFSEPIALPATFVVSLQNNNSEEIRVQANFNASVYRHYLTLPGDGEFHEYCIPVTEVDNYNSGFSVLEILNEAGGIPLGLMADTLNVYQGVGSYSLVHSPISNIVLKNADGVPLSAFGISHVVQTFSGYGWGVSDTIYNYIDFENKQFVKRVGVVDLGTLEWQKADKNRFFASPPNLKPSASNNSYPNAIMASDYVASTGNEYVNCEKSYYVETIPRLGIRDTSFTDAATFKSAMSGVMFCYELEVPEITDISGILPDDNYIEVSPGGTIEFVPELDGYGQCINDTVYNYIDFENKQFVKRVGAVDMGTLDWKYTGNQFVAPLADAIDMANGTGCGTCSKYAVRFENADKVCYFTETSVGMGVVVTDDDYVNIATFKAAMSGVMLYYELATAVVTYISDILNAVPSSVVYQVKGEADSVTDEHINSLIDAKLGVIENGTY